ncbi:MAG: DeoR/GlpR family DNA-binding transcription regulator [Clostridia bacterium]|nr:DeoR/GlpR family DNA-binding transcription regulator [Clostridia bacterium]
MFGVERRSKILSLLNEKKSITVQEAAEGFGVTEETIRRDLKVLEGQGLLMRTHGGAVLADDSKAEAPLEIRQGINIKGKDAIGREAAKLVKDGDTIILDASTSSLFVARHIKDRVGVTVITNAEKVVLELSDCEEITVICTGGTLRHKSLSYVGRAAESMLSNYHADMVFLSCKGFSPDKGFTDSNEQESDIRKLMIACSEKVIYLCDHTKFDKVGYVTTARLTDTDIFISDSSISQEWQCKLKDAEVILRIAD